MMGRGGWWIWALRSTCGARGKKLRRYGTGEAARTSAQGEARHAAHAYGGRHRRARQALGAVGGSCPRFTARGADMCGRWLPTGSGYAGLPAGRGLHGWHLCRLLADVLLLAGRPLSPQPVHNRGRRGLKSRKAGKGRGNPAFFVPSRACVRAAEMSGANGQKGRAVSRFQRAGRYYCTFETLKKPYIARKNWLSSCNRLFPC